MRLATDRYLTCWTFCGVLACCLSIVTSPLLAQSGLPAVQLQAEIADQGGRVWSQPAYSTEALPEQDFRPAVESQLRLSPPIRPAADPDRFRPGARVIPSAYETEQADLSQRLELLEASQQRLERLLDDPDEQDAPGADDGPLYQPLPEYYYGPSYYNSYYGGARPLADYAPPGFLPREQQEGPGAPEFTRITPPPEVTENERVKLVTRGMYPGSFLAPGTNTSVRLRGFVRLAALYDFDPIGSTDSFVTNTIPVPQEIGQNYNMSGRISRFVLETWTPTSFCDWNVHTFIESDFFNGPAQAAGGGGNPFRLRHAFIDFGYFRFGQQNSVFMDGTNWPSLVDFQGPNSWANQRQPAARITIPLSHRIYWAGSIERCFSDITTGGLGTPVQDVPDFATHLRYEADRGHLQVSGLLRTIGYQPTGGDVERLTASAVSGNAVFHPWAILLGTDPVRDEYPSGLTRSRILLQATWGAGVGRYINDLAGQGLDAQVDPLTGEFELVDTMGWNISYEHWFNANGLTNITYANVDVDNNANQLAGAYDSAHYLAGSLWWIPVPRLSFGIELISGERENFDGRTGRTQRLHGLAQYNF